MIQKKKRNQRKSKSAPSRSSKTPLHKRAEGGIFGAADLPLPVHALSWKALWIQVLILAAAVAAVYANTLDVPFYLDDHSSIRENPAIYDWRDLNRIWRFSPLRVVGYFSFALNYHWHQFQVAGYHLVNILIHFFSGCAVLALGKGLVQTPVLAGSDRSTATEWFPALAALIFVLHPLQHQAVTYIVQRLAAMAALWYIAALACYVYARLAGEWIHKWLFSAGIVVFGTLAFFTKQNSATLPLAILVVEAIFFPGNRKKRVWVIAGTVVFLGAAWVLFAQLLRYDPFSIDAMQALTRETTIISRQQYLLTQLKVLWIYLKLFIWPIGLHFDRDVSLAVGFFDVKVILSMIGHLGLLIGAFLVRRRYPVAAFAVFFYYLAHLVESSFIPIRDVYFEHRAYLPNLGLCLGFGCLAVRIEAGKKKGYGKACVVGLLLCALGAATWQRNQLWREPIRFWEYSVRHFPESDRSWNELGQHLLQAGKTKEAVKALSRAIRHPDPDDPERIKFSEDTALNLLIALRRLGRVDEALKFADDILKRPMSPQISSKVLDTVGYIYAVKAQYPKAEEYFKRAVQAYPENLEAMNNLGGVYALQGRIDDANDLFQKVLEMYPQHRQAMQNLKRLTGG